MTAFPEKLRGKTFCLERWGAESQSWRRAGTQTAAFQVSQSHLQPCPDVPLGRAGRTLWVCFAHFIPAKLLQDWKISPVKGSWIQRHYQEHPPAPSKSGSTFELLLVPSSLPDERLRGFSVTHKRHPQRQVRLPKHHFHTVPRTIPPHLNVSGFWSLGV